MDVEIVTIGDELLLGLTTDTNASWLSRALAEMGANVVRRSTVGDDIAVIAREVGAALERTGAVITSGGLGPTTDDVSREAVALVFGREMIEDREILRRLEKLFRSRGYTSGLPAANRRQAMVPTGATIMPNNHGTAPGLWIEDARGWVAMLPGVPRELKGLFADEVRPRVHARVVGDVAVVSRTLRTTGIAESALADLIEQSDFAPASLAYLPGTEGVDLRVTSRGVGRAVAGERLAADIAALKKIVGDFAYGEGDTDLAAVVLEIARERKHTIAVAESCTGGMLGARLTAIPGASNVFTGGVIAYSNSVKAGVLHVSSNVVQAHGAVSEPVVLAMAASVRELLGCSVGVAISGIAGPGGGSAEKPVGTVWVAVATDSKKVAERRVLPGSRDEVRQRAAQMALNMMRLHIERAG